MDIGPGKTRTLVPYSASTEFFDFGTQCRAAMHMFTCTVVELNVAGGSLNPNTTMAGFPGGVNAPSTNIDPLKSESSVPDQ